MTKPNFPNFDLNIPDQYRADLFQKDFASYVKNANLPTLNLAWIMSDHTAGTTPGGITPSAYVADNDLATGRMIDTISHSPYWKDSAIFVIEDDTQKRCRPRRRAPQPDLRRQPLRQAGVGQQRYYSQLNVVRTIEQILGLPPMNQQDLTAEPMYDAFTNQAGPHPLPGAAQPGPAHHDQPDAVGERRRGREVLGRLVGQAGLPFRGHGQHGSAQP